MDLLVFGLRFPVEKPFTTAKLFTTQSYRLWEKTLLFPPGPKNEVALFCNKK